MFFFVSKYRLSHLKEVYFVFGFTNRQSMTKLTNLQSVTLIGFLLKVFNYKKIQFHMGVQKFKFKDESKPFSFK